MKTPSREALQALVAYSEAIESGRSVKLGETTVVDSRGGRYQAITLYGLDGTPAMIFQVSDDATIDAIVVPEKTERLVRETTCSFCGKLPPGGCIHFRPGETP